MRVFDAVCLSLAVVVAGYVYKVKHEAEIAQADKVSLERDIAIVSRDVHLLEADLAALDHPGRMQGLVQSMGEDFRLEPIAASHYIRLSDIPFRSDLVVPESDAEDGEVPMATSDTAIEAPQLPGTGDGIAGLLNDQLPAATDAPGIDALLTELRAPEQDVAPQEPVQDVDTDGIAALLEGRQ